MSTMLIRVLPLLIASVGFSACGDDNDGPLERAGEEVDEAADEVGDAVDPNH